MESSRVCSAYAEGGKSLEGWVEGQVVYGTEGGVVQNTWKGVQCP